jgi:uncharacterized protein
VRGVYRRCDCLPTMAAVSIIMAKRREIRALVKQHRFSNPRVFGSVARGEAGPTSDVGLLVRYCGGDIRDTAGLAIDLRELLGPPVSVTSDNDSRVR